jgi:hypothetical protein
MSIFQNFDIISIFFTRKNERGEKFLELLATCKSTKIFFAHSRKKLWKNPLVPFSPVQPWTTKPGFTDQDHDHQTALPLTSILSHSHFRKSLHDGVLRDVEVQQRRKIENLYQLQHQIDTTKVLKQSREASSSSDPLKTENRSSSSSISSSGVGINVTWHDSFY